MTTHLGEDCIAPRLTCKTMNVKTDLMLSKTAHIHMPSSDTNEHLHKLGTNHSVMYFKYALSLPIDKLSVTDGSSKCKITFDNAHHFDGTVTGLKMTLSLATISPMTHAGGDHSLTVADFIGKRDIDTWSNALSNDELEFDLATNSSSTGEITITGGVGTVLIYKYLDMAGPGTTWELQIDTAPGALHS